MWTKRGQFPKKTFCCESLHNSRKKKHCVGMLAVTTHSEKDLGETVAEKQNRTHDGINILRRHELE